jgi:hypothetical protein
MTTPHAQRSPYGDDDPAPPVRYVTGPAVLYRYGISNMTLHRWRQGGFPPPAMIVNGRRYWREQDLLAWERSHVPRGVSRETATS